MHIDDLDGVFYRLGLEKIRPTLLQRDQSGAFDPALWQSFAKAGLFRLLISDSLPGAMKGLYSICSGGLDLPMTSSLAAHGVVGLDLLLNFGSKDQIQNYLEPMMEGKLIAAICNNEEGAGTDIRRMKSNLNVNTGELSVVKHAVTNGSVANLFFVSVVVKREGVPDRIEVLLLDKEMVHAQDLSQDISCFKSGPTGRVEVREKDFDIEKYVLGREGTGFPILRRCFHMERLAIGSMVCGMLAGMEREAFTNLEAREQGGARLFVNQYVQQKFLVIYSARKKMESLLGGILDSGAESLDPHAKDLGLLKWMSTRHGLESALAFFELFGFGAVMSAHPAQKIVRDFLGLRYFGGTMELQKMAIFNDLLKEHQARADAKKAAA